MARKEIAVATTGGFRDGEMRQVSADGTDILSARVGGRYFAVGAHCTHYGAPLAEGALCGERVVCPWHHACFNVTTGDMEEPPAFDALPRYEVRVEGESVVVSLPDEITDRRTPAMTKREAASDGRLFVILGGGAVAGVVLDSGERVEADLVVVGVGVRPATDLLEGVELHEDGGACVDKHLRAADGVYAAGDIAYFPSPSTGERQRIEHWRTAEQQGRTAAHNMAGRNVEFGGVPFFWTRQFDAGLLHVGHAAGWDEIIFEGDVPSRDFLAFYLKDDRVLAVAGMNRDREMAAVEELMRLGRMPAPDRLRDGPVDFLELLGVDGAGVSLGRDTAVVTV